MRTLQLSVTGPEDAPTVRLIDLATRVELAATDPQAPGRPALDSAGIRARFGNPQTLQAALIKDGQRMFAWLTHGPIAAAWQKERAAGSHTVLDIAEPTLRDLPWELLAKGAMALFGQPPDVARFHDRPIAPDESACWPTRMLILVGALPSDPPRPGEKALDTVAEVRRIKQGLLHYRHSVDLEVEVQPTLARFQELLAEFQPHVFHFVGHSGISKTSGLPTLFVQGPAAWDLDATKITASFGVTHAILPRLVFLNACHTADGEWLSIADAFIDLGVPACLAMRGDIRDDRAGLFAATFYRHLWEGGTIDAAVTIARRELQDVKPAASWAFPVLSLATSAETVFHPRPKTADDDERDKDIELCKMFEDVRLFSGRVRERRKLRSAFQPIIPNGPARHLMVMTGDPKWGKSHIIKRCLECFALGGHNVQYVEIADERAKNFIDVLVDILTSSPTCAVSPIAPEILYEFKWDVTQILTRGAVTPWDGHPIEGPVSFDANEVMADDPMRAIFAAFWKALKAASATRPLLIVLDQFRTGEKDSLALAPNLLRDMLWPHWLEPLEEGALPNVGVVLVLRTRDARDEYGLQRLVRAEAWLSVNDFPRTDFKELAEELLGYAGDEDLPGVSDLTSAIGKWLNARNGTSTVAALEKLAKSADMMFGTTHKDLVGRSQ
jgi:hypothetical protein